MYRHESWTIKKAKHQRIDVFELWCWRGLLRVPWTGRRSNQSILNKNQPWIFIGRTDAEAPLLWLPDAKIQLIRKDPDAGKDWGQEEKGITEDEMVVWNHQLNVHEFEQAWGVGDGQGSLACCSPWGRRESDMTEQLNNNKNDHKEITRVGVQWEEQVGQWSPGHSVSRRRQKKSPQKESLAAQSWWETLGAAQLHSGMEATLH